jgi:flagellar biosynthesis anti-sigma factor FlgM
MVIKNDIRGLGQPKAPSLQGGPTATSLQQPTPNKSEPAVRIGISDAAAAVAAQNSASTSAAVQAHASDKFDMELVKEIRQRLADGTFEIDYNKVAGNLLGDAVAAVRAGRK